MSSLFATWVVGRYTGERAKSVLAHYEHGVGYFDLENIGTKFNPEVIAYFRYIQPGPLPEYLQEVRDKYKIERLEKQRMSRMGVSERPEIRKATDETVKQVKEIFFSKKTKG